MVATNMSLVASWLVECTESSNESEMELPADKRTSELHLTSIKFSGRFGKTLIHSSQYGFQNSLTDRESFFTQPSFHQSSFSFVFSLMKAFTLIWNKTNRYASQYLDTPVDFEPSSPFLVLSDTSPNEIKALTALEIQMGLCQKPTHPDYWIRFLLTAVPSSFVMSRNRFWVVANVFYTLVKLKNKLTGGQMVTTLYLKSSVFFTLWTQPMRDGINQKPDLSLNESMVKFKGRLAFRQYLPAKPTRWGIKTICFMQRLKLATAWSLLPPVAKHRFTSVLSGCVVFTRGLWEQGWHCSPYSAPILEELNIGACGTVKASRKLLPAKLPLQKGDLQLLSVGVGKASQKMGDVGLFWIKC